MSTPLFEDFAQDYRAKEVPAPRRIRDGVWSVPIPLANSPLRFITIHVVETPEGPVLIDAAYDAAGCWSALVDRLDAIGQPVASVRAVLLTHNHPDHVGLAEQIRSASDAEIAIDREDDFEHQRQTRGGFLQQLARALEMSGTPNDTVAAMFAGAQAIANHPESLVPDILLDGDVELNFGGVAIHAIRTPGHTPGHRVYLTEDVVFTGDTMMPEGPVQMGVSSLPSDAPARDLLQSLERIQGLPARIVCPAHQYPFVGASARAAELIALHSAELATVQQIATPQLTAWELAPRLTWAKDWAAMGTGTRRFALVQTLALLQSISD